ncbi:YciI family protein [Sediminicoccus sp. KRV36]|uniref:YciI family protein n=1 Tax=Sediminicoccus sp. KRV36 TaxID=3133721 RepID=UPI002010A9B8|nr:YciI family protein [Sediminicoccus rosea]UPY36034.1 YciI family protein [Sediminicoccus rosea]
MQYVMLFAEPASEFEKRQDPAAAPAYWGAWMGYIGAMREAGIMIGGHGLEPASLATTLRLREGQRHVQDGPYADSKEQLGGFIAIDVPNLDAALEWAARSPAAAFGAVEIRPVLPPPPAEA